MDNSKSAVDVADKVVDKLDTYVQAISELVKQYAPDVTNVVLNVARIEACSWLLFGISMLIESFVIYRYSKAMWLTARYIDKEHGKAYWNDDEMPFYVTAIFGGIAILITFTIGIINILNIWNWVGMFNPILYLAHKFMP